MTELAAEVRRFARRNGLTVADARDRLIAAALHLDDADRSDAAVVEAFLHGAQFEQERVAGLVGAADYGWIPVQRLPAGRHLQLVRPGR